eukprot:3880108-Rhodomonas_salina.2
MEGGKYYARDLVAIYRTSEPDIAYSRGVAGHTDSGSRIGGIVRGGRRESSSPTRSVCCVSTGHGVQSALYAVSAPDTAHCTRRQKTHVRYAHNAHRAAQKGLVATSVPS